MIYPINYSGYATNAQNQRLRAFRGSNPIEPSVIQPSFKASQTPSQDVVQISAGDKIKESSNSKKTEMSIGAKWALGILCAAAAAYGCVVGHRMLTKPSIEKSCKGFF